VNPAAQHMRGGLDRGIDGDLGYNVCKYLALIVIFDGHITSDGYGMDFRKALRCFDSENNLGLICQSPVDLKCSRYGLEIALHFP
jgi:hypothetical protein